jgi:hypothetical protein
VHLSDTCLEVIHELEKNMLHERPICLMKEWVKPSGPGAASLRMENRSWRNSSKVKGAKTTSA